MVLGDYVWIIGSLISIQSIKNKYHIPIIEDQLDKLFEAKIFSKIDLRSNHHPNQDEKRRYLNDCIHNTYGSLYEYIVMPFGIKQMLMQPFRHFE
jgi:hypothetical protein